MTSLPTIDVVIPAQDEEEALPLVLAALPREWVRRTVVADNGSRDRTAEAARSAGAIVVSAPQAGYGNACLTALEFLRGCDPPQIVVFLDADYSDHPDELPQLVSPLLADGGSAAHLVIGSRILGEREPGALLAQARIGNWVACRLIHLLYGRAFTDLGPFRAIRWDAMESLRLRDPDFGWTAEMQVKALRRGLRVVEVPVRYRRRLGSSKITGTLQGTVRAGYKILWTVLRYSLWRP